MTTRTDPLVVPSLEGPDRLHYIQGTLLDTDDFTDEQNYHRGRLARGLEYLFGPGTIAGLDVSLQPDGEQLLVSPGLALDPLGRLIEVPRAQCIRIHDWFVSQRLEDLRDSWIAEGGPAVLVADVFIRFQVEEQGKTPKFAEGPFDALNAVAPSRLRDDFELGLVVREEAGARRADLAVLPPLSEDDIADIPIPDQLEVIASLPPGNLPATHTRILELWRDEVADWKDGRPPRLSEHLRPRVQLVADDQTQIGRDTTSLMLARLNIRVTPPATAADPPTDLTDTASRDALRTYLLNTGRFIRRFVYALGHLTQPAERNDSGVAP